MLKLEFPAINCLVIRSPVIFNYLQNIKLRKVDGDQNESASIIVTPELIIDDGNNGDDIKEKFIKNLLFQILIHAVIIIYFFYVLFHFISSE